MANNRYFLNRRNFLLRGLLSALAPLWAPLIAARQVSANTGTDVGVFTPSRDIWRTLDHLQHHLLPNGAGLPPSLTVALLPEKSRRRSAPPVTPGAGEIDALNFLHGMFADPAMDPANKRLIRDGAANLQVFSLDSTGKPFEKLDAQQKETVLRDFEKTPGGDRFLGKIMEYLIEALLGDPVYGGNTDDIGWRWLNHDPGFPRPPVDKRYFSL